MDVKHSHSTRAGSNQRGKGGVLSVVAGLLVLAFGCGGGSPRNVAATAAADESESDEEPAVEIAPETMDEIKSSFDRKRRIVSRCFADALEAGQVKKDDRGYITLALTITPSGKPAKLRIAEASLPSEMLKNCVLELAGRWTFTRLPKSLDYTYSFGFERL